MRSLLWGGAAVAALVTACGGSVRATDDDGDDDDDGNGGSATGGAGGVGVGGGGSGGVPPNDPFVPFTLAASRVFLGQTDWDGTPVLPSVGWKEFGHDLDGIITTNDFSGHCQPFGNTPAAEVHGDGTRGVDNSFGQNLLPIVFGFAADFEAQINAGIQTGEHGHLLALDGSTTAAVTVSYHRATSLGAPPVGDDCWPVAPEGLSNPADPSSAIVTVSGAFDGDGFATEAAAPGVVLELSLGDSTAFPIRMPIHGARWTMEASPAVDGTLRVTLGGVMPTEAFIAAFQELAGNISEELCTGSTFESIANQMRAASDIMSDGTQNPNAVCNGISVGVGFEMAAASICGVGPAEPPTTNPCL